MKKDSVKGWNGYTYTEDEKVMICQIRNTLQELSDKVNTDKIKRADLVTVLGATRQRIEKLNELIEGGDYTFVENFTKGDSYFSKSRGGEGTQNANIGDFILKGIDGECWPVKPHIFNKTYDILE